MIKAWVFELLLELLSQKPPPLQNFQGSGTLNPHTLPFERI